MRNVSKIKKLNRPCKRCGNKFEPQGKFNYICPMCNTQKGQAVYSRYKPE